ncbi:hypothetical protein ARMSODRAFT_979231 [Armillaria solidipes]|uniref:Uncharacterized protein n=1 Tax=Armillaria solidipes TaxID=1076256 RepID=A0A2H3BIM5_9AGAR|nr:hypothetical protein ARMSODRAFT_979231 [Armillaria solidipes]
MWTTGVFVNNSVPAFSRRNYDDITEEYALSPAERAKYGKDARKKTVKTKRVSLYLATLDSWKHNKWIDLLNDIKEAVETSSSRKKRKISTLAHSTSPDLVEEEPVVVFQSDPPEPDSDEGSGDEGSASVAGEEDDEGMQDVTVAGDSDADLEEDSGEAQPGSNAGNAMVKAANWVRIELLTSTAVTHDQPIPSPQSEAKFESGPFANPSPHDPSSSSTLVIVTAQYI